MGVQLIIAHCSLSIVMFNNRTKMKKGLYLAVERLFYRILYVAIQQVCGNGQSERETVDVRRKTGKKFEFHYPRSVPPVRNASLVPPVLPVHPTWQAPRLVPEVRRCVPDGTSGMSGGRGWEIKFELITSPYYLSESYGLRPHFLPYPIYSLRKLSTGLATAAFTACRETVASAISIAVMPAMANMPVPISMR